MSRPRLLDLYCGAGGAARGYQMAGFYVVGIDNRPQPRYAGDEFIQANALDFMDGDGWQGFDAIHASPPCQYYSRLRHLPWLRRRVYWRSIPATRERLQATARPFVVENVSDAAWDMIEPVILCGQALGLALYRHRAFEIFPPLFFLQSPCSHRSVIEPGRASLGKRHHGNQGFKEINRSSVAGHISQVARARQVMGIDWMTRDELSQAIPPAYTEYVGNWLMKYLNGEQAL